MSDITIRVDQLSKAYHIGRQEQSNQPLGYRSLREVLAGRVGRAIRCLRRRTPPNGQRSDGMQQTLWALDDLSFEVKRGEVVGVIGRNGAGKSTLLKILARITEPTKGGVELHGRIGSLLEVGTGFHLELTGRENIYLNGAILGMRRAEIMRRFEAIVAFAEIEKFLDTPVKHYSSGMYMRLAFAVAAHLEPEILLVDEVLAVGDVQFQKKCLGKMGDVAKSGRTVLFVSHNMDAVRALCTRVLHLHGGRLIGNGSVEQEVQAYLAPTSTNALRATGTPYRLSHDLTISKLALTPNPLVSGAAVQLQLEFHSTTIASFSELSVLIYSDRGQRVAILDLRKADVYHQFDAHGRCALQLWIKSLPLVEGDYSVGLYLKSNLVNGDFLELTNFTVYPSTTATNGMMRYSREYRGFLELDYTFSDCHLQTGA